MTESESVALPLGDTPIFFFARRTALACLNIIMYCAQNFKRFCVRFFIFTGKFLRAVGVVTLGAVWRGDVMGGGGRLADGGVIRKDFSTRCAWSK